MEEGAAKLLIKPHPGDRRMDSKAQRLGLALKKRRATPPHPAGKEVREGLWRRAFLAAENERGLSCVLFPGSPGCISCLLYAFLLIGLVGFVSFYLVQCTVSKMGPLWHLREHPGLSARVFSGVRCFRGVHAVAQQHRHRGDGPAGFQQFLGRRCLELCVFHLESKLVVSAWLACRAPLTHSVADSAVILC